jgi:transmembrane sensor
MPMNRNATPINDDLLVKYLLDEASATERQQVEAWLQDDPSHQQYYQHFKLILQKSELNNSDTTQDHEALARLNERMQQEGLLSNRKPFFSWTRAVAAILILGVSTWFAYTLINQEAPAIQVQTTTNTLQQELADGSIVTLNKNSALSTQFTTNERLVNLKGEAFFKVSANAKKPFVIKVDGLTVKVIGTSFNVKSRNEHIVVIVESGIVKVSKANQSVELRKGEKVELIGPNASLTKEKNNSSLYNYYYSHEIVCQQTRLDELVPILNEKFDTKITITRPALQELPINTTFKEETLDQILDVIAKTHGLQVIYSGNQILLK